MDIKFFENDQRLVHGEISVDNSLVPPAAYGTYSIRLPNDSLSNDALGKIKIMLWSCMDRRAIRPLYDKLLKKYPPQEALVISMGGGPIQVGQERITGIKNAFTELAPKLPNLEKIWAVAHTKTCGGLKYFCGGKPITEVLKSEIAQQANTQAQDVELYATQIILPQALELVPVAWKKMVEFAVAEPDEINKTVIIHQQPALLVSQPLSEIIN